MDTIPAMRTLLLPLLLLSFTACALTSHPVVPQPTPRKAAPASWAEALSGPARVSWEPVLSARWQADASGLLDLSDPKAADLPDVPMPIVLPVHLLTHPTRGLFALDTGLSTARAEGRDDGVNVLLQSFLDGMEPVEPLGAILKRRGEPLRGVLFTHLHVDHVLGLPDVPPGTPLYTGPGEAAATGFQNLFLRGSYTALLEGHAPLRELDRADAVAIGPMEAALDWFGDGSLWVLFVPGHTPGSLAFLANTPEGPVLFTGDTCHTRVGFERGVPPGSFTSDPEANRRALEALRALRSELPTLRVVTGHEWAPIEPG